MAYEACSRKKTIFLPCNVIVYEEDGKALFLLCCRLSLYKRCQIRQLIAKTAEEN